MAIITRKTNREHVCDWCGGGIAMHEYHRNEKAKDLRWHIGCPPIIALDNHAFVLCGEYTKNQVRAMVQVFGPVHVWHRLGKRCAGGIKFGFGQPVTLVTYREEHEIRAWVPFHPGYS